MVWKEKGSPGRDRMKSECSQASGLFFVWGCEERCGSICFNLLCEKRQQRKRRIAESGRQDGKVQHQFH